MSRTRAYTSREETANALSHGLGILLGIAAGCILMVAAVESGNHWKTVSVCIYLFGMLSSYFTSTIYHSCTNPLKKEFFRKFDHAAIYAHIAGTYTPFTLVVLRDSGAWGWILFSFIWLAAIVGIYFSFYKLKPHSNLETICFVLMGGSILAAFKPLTETLGAMNQMNSLYWLIAGGVSYIVGAIFYSWTKREYMHTVFHLFVLGGSLCHIIAIYIIL